MVNMVWQRFMCDVKQKDIQEVLVVCEFVNDKEKTNKRGYFETVAEEKGYKIKRTRPYSSLAKW